MKQLFVLLVTMLILGCSSQKNTCINLRHLKSKAEKVGKKVSSPRNSSQHFVFVAPVETRIEDLYASTHPIPEILKDDIEQNESISNTAPHREMTEKELVTQLGKWGTEVRKIQEVSVKADTVINYKKTNRRSKLPNRLGVISKITGIAGLVSIFFFPLLWLLLFVTSIVTGGVSLFLSHVYSEKASKHALWGFLFDFLSFTAFILLAISAFLRL